MPELPVIITGGAEQASVPLELAVTPGVEVFCATVTEPVAVDELAAIVAVT